jgi:hypothetical protein
MSWIHSMRPFGRPWRRAREAEALPGCEAFDLIAQSIDLSVIGDDLLGQGEVAVYLRLHGAQAALHPPPDFEALIRCYIIRRNQKTPDRLAGLAF